MTPGARSNTKYRCKGCGAIYDFTDRLPTFCECGEYDWNQLVIAHVCDICGSDQAHWEFPCRDFECPAIAGLPLRQMSRGSWAACDRCHDLIETNERERMAALGIANQIEDQPIMRSMREPLLQLVRAMHDSFFENRTGPAINHDA